MSEQDNETAASSPLTERYVAVTLGNVPLAQRDAAEPALRAAIEDEVEDRYDRLLGEENITRDDIEVDVLEEMGDPEQVAAAMTHRPKVLVGSRFYPDYKYIVWWSLAVVALIAGALAAVSSAQAGADLSSIIIHSAGTALTAAVYAAAWVTLGFAIAERVARHRAEVAAAEWTVDLLPAPARSVITVTQTAVVVVAALAAAVAIVVQQVDPSVFTDLNVPVVFLNPNHWPWLWSGIVVLLGINAWLAIARHVRGHWTMRAAIVNLVMLTATYGAMAWMLFDHSFVNDAFFDEVGWPTDELPPATLEDWALIAVGVLWLTGIAVGLVRAWRARAANSISSH